MKSLASGVYRGASTDAAAKIVAPANNYRRGLTFQNTSDIDMWVTEHGVNAATGVGYKVAPGVSMNVGTTNSISVFAASAGKTFAATEY